MRTDPRFLLRLCGLAAVFIAPALVIPALVAPAEAASLRSLVVLSSPMVRLSDLFDDAGPNAERVLGPAPQPGARVTVPAQQLAAIAHQFGVAWEPSSDRDQVVLERPARALARSEITDALHAALTDAGAGQDCAIALSSFSAPAVAADTPLHAVVEQIDFDAATSHFTATLGLTAPGMPPRHLTVSGHAWPMVEVPVAALQLPAGTHIGAGDIRLERVRRDQIPGDVVRDLAEVEGMALRHAAAAGRPIPRADLIRPPLVQRGLPVRVTLDQPGLSMVVQGQALQDGMLGAVVRVVNPLSHAVVDAEVTGPQAARVMPGSFPEVPPSIDGLSNGLAQTTNFGGQP
jgi:flagella basal body P-ring formation protein FlgA